MRMKYDIDELEALGEKFIEVRVGHIMVRIFEDESVVIEDSKSTKTVPVVGSYDRDLGGFVVEGVVISPFVQLKEERPSAKNRKNAGNVRSVK